jgi:TolB protein
MDSDGSGERIVTAGPSDEQPAWSPASSRILFERIDPASRRSVLATVPAAGGEIRPVPTPQGASDPQWVQRKE